MTADARQRELAARVERLERELADARAALAARPDFDRSQLLALMDSMPILVSVIGPDHRYQFVNRAYEAWFGGNRSALAGRHLGDVLGEGAYARVRPYLERALAGERAGFEGELPYRSGGTRYVQATYVPRPAADGRTTGVVALVVDLTRRHADEAALLESEARLTAVLESVSDGFFAIDADWRFTVFNTAAERHFGRLRDDVLGRRIWDLLPGGRESGFGRRLVQIASTGEPAAFEMRSRARPDRVVEMRVSPQFGGGLAVSFSDITGRRRAEDSLRISEERLRLATEGAGMGTWDFDLIAGRGHWSDSSFAIMGYAPTPDRSWTFDMWLARVHPDDVARAREAAARAKAEGGSYGAEYRVRRADDGQERWVQAFGHYVYDAAGVPVRYIGVFFDITERKRADEALRESEARFAAIANSIDQMIWSTRPDGFHDYYNDRWYEYTGVPYGSTDGEAWNDMFHPDDRERAWTTWRRCLETGEPYHIEYRLRHRSGQYRWVIGRAQPVRDEAGRIVRWYGTCTDVHDLKTAEAALRESEERFRLIADSAPVPMWVTRLDRKREFVNRAYVDFLGISYEEAVDFDWRSVIHPDDLPRIHAEQVEKEASLRPFTLEARYRDARGEQRWLRSESRPRWGPNGEHVGYIGVAYDVTIAKDAETALQALVAERTAELEALYTKTPTILQSQSPDGRLISVSDKWLEFMGYDHRDEVIGRPIRDFIAPESVERHVAENWPRLLAEGGFDDVEYRALKKSGEIAEVLVSSRVWYDARGRFARTMAAIADVTDKKRTEEALRQAQKMEAIGQLTGGVAHDFNNLLTPIMGSLDMLRRRVTGDERAQRTVDLALQATSRATTLVQRLLAFARRQDLEARSVDVADLLAGIEELVARSLGSGVRVVVEAPASLPPAHADPNQLELAILNLAINARDAMPGGGTLTIRARERELGRAAPDLKAGRYVRLSVSDTGVGMDEGTLRRAIEPFFSTKGVGKGTGLGLSMVHGLAAQLGGALRLSSTPGVGTTAELWLPVAAEPVASAAVPATAPHRAERAAVVLLVDDEDLVRAGTADMLADLGYRVVEAGSGREALAKLREGLAPDLLVTDYLMPDMNGADLALEAVRAQPDLPVLMITGYTNLERQTGNLPRLMKPFRQEELAARVAALLRAGEVG